MRKFLAVLFLAVSALSINAEDLFLNGVRVISTFEVEENIADGYLVLFPKDVGQTDLAGVKEIVVYCGVDKKGYKKDYTKESRTKLHESDLAPVIAKLDIEGRYYVADFGRDAVKEAFRGIFWATTTNGKPVWANCDKSLSKVKVDPHGVRVGEYFAYYWDFPALK